MPTLENNYSPIAAPSISVPTVPRGSKYIFNSKFWFYGKLAIAAATMFLLTRTISVPALFVSFAEIRMKFVVPALSLLWLNIFIQHRKWWYLLKIADANISAATAWRSLLVGFPLGFITPGRLGEVGRALCVRELSQVRTFALVVVDKITTIYVVLTAGLAGLLTLPALELNPTVRAGLEICLMLLLGFLLFAITSSTIAKALSRFTRIPGFKQRNLTAALACSIIFYLTFVAQLMLLVLAFGETNATLVSARAAVSVFLVKTVLPIAFGDLGIRESAAVFFYSKIGVGVAAAFQASVMLYLINVCFPAVLGLPVLLKTKRGQPQ